MRVLLTGASSFTGYWFGLALSDAGFEVVAPLRGAADGYAGVRRERIDRLSGRIELIPNAPFGGERFLEVLDGRDWSLLCHHAANVDNYKSPDFDIAGALADNTRNLSEVLRRFAERGGRGVVLSGSVFEAGEGAGEKPLRAFSPYGLSKGFTADVFRHWAAIIGLPLGKFVIPNPFGPFEEPRFCAYLMSNWLKGATPTVQTPEYVRDNVHIDLLAAAYAAYAVDMTKGAAQERFNPSGYVETQGAFALRFAREMEARLGLPTPVSLLRQTDFSEPMVRINTDVLRPARFDWNESRAWSAVAEYYRPRQGGS
jgi:UDP-glucose 4-epimerase